jgi:hypothetical protein
MPATVYLHLYPAQAMYVIPAVLKAFPLPNQGVVTWKETNLSRKLKGESSKPKAGNSCFLL